MILLDGKATSKKILSTLKEKIFDLKKEVNLDIVLVGLDPASVKYVELKQKKLQKLVLAVNFIVFQKTHR